MTAAHMLTWREAIAEFTASQRANGISEGSAEIHARRLGALARQLPTGPWEVTTAQLTDWLDNHSGAAATIRGYRLSIRAFYGHAVANGKVSSSPAPTAAPVTRYTLPERWQDGFAAFEAAQAAKGIRPATLRQRLKYVTRFARDIDTTPWQVTAEQISEWLSALQCLDSTRRAHREALRAFYRWATAAGRITEDPTAERSRRATALSVPENWAGELRAYRSALRGQGKPNTTISAYLDRIGRFARENASLAPFAVTLDDILEWMSGKRWSVESRRGYRNTFVSFYRWAEDTERCENNPTDRMPVFKAEPPQPRPALDADYAAALARADKRERLALRLAAELGMRRGEVARVHARDVIGNGGVWSLTVHGKGGKPRTVPLPQSLALSLRAAGEGYVFPGNDDGHLSARYLGKLISQLLPEGITMHALRHRFATRAYNIDRDVFTVQQLLGHASPATTQRYVQVSDSGMRRLVDLIAG